MKFTETETTERTGASTLYDLIESPVGELLLTGDGRSLRGLYMQAGPRPVPIARSWRRAPEAFAEAGAQLEEYFAGRRRRFDLPLAMEGTGFQLEAWRQLREIGFGETISYGEQAKRMGHPEMARAVGTANGQNPISIIVPCHRVIGADGSLTGYGGGLERKRKLLELEADVVSPRLFAGA